MYQEHLSYADVCRLNVAIFDPGDLKKDATWPEWRQPAGQHIPAALPAEEPEALSPPHTQQEVVEEPDRSLLSDSLVIRRSVINLQCNRDSFSKPSDSNHSTPIPQPRPSCASDCRSPDRDTASFTTPTKYNKEVKEIDQETSPKLVILIDTRFAEPKPAASATDLNVPEEEVPEEEEELATHIPELEIHGDRSSEEASPTPSQEDQDELILPGDSSPLLKQFKSYASEYSESSLVKEERVSSPLEQEDGADNSELISSEQSSNHQDDQSTLNSCKLKSILNSEKRSRTVRKLGFRDISLFYFHRQQGWVGVPREGGNTLG